MRTRQELKNCALEKLNGHWTSFVLLTLILSLLFVFSAIPLAGIFVSIFSIVFGVGMYNSYMLLYRNGSDEALYNTFAYPFTDVREFFKILGTMLLTIVYIYLWTLLFIIPGLIFSYAYSLVPFLIIDRKDLSITETISLSRKMMKGHKFDLFVLQLSFIGWWLLSLLTFGIGFLWLVPYYCTTLIAFYEDVRKQYYGRSLENQEFTKQANVKTESTSCASNSNFESNSTYTPSKDRSAEDVIKNFIDSNR